MEDSTQMFIEAPYRTVHVLDNFLNVLHDDTLLCAAWELTTLNQGVVAQTVGLWKKSPLPNLDKRSAIFLISAS
jgi:16S rRNA (cytidine1402-2'-O)-methyltransferase